MAMTRLKWLWDWRVAFWIGLVDGLPVVDVTWEQRTPAPWQRRKP